MMGIVDWCYRKAPYSICKVGTYAVIDYMGERVIDDYLLKHSKYDVSYLKTISIDDLANIDPEEQYITLLSHIFCNGIDHVPTNNMVTFIEWMLSDEELYETGLIAYIWNNSLLNSQQSFRTHSMMLDIVSNGCDRETLRFLWEVAKSGDIFLCTVVTSLEYVIGTVSYLKLVSYLYICSGIDINDILSFIADVKNLSDIDIHRLTNLVTYYHWDGDTILSCLSKGYTISRLEKYLETYANSSFLKEGRLFPSHKLGKKIFTVKSRFKKTDISLPRKPKGYIIQYHIWNKAYPVKVFNDSTKTKYEKWFESLNKEKLKAFKNMNPVAYNACMEGNTRYVEKLLDDIMTII